jgi:hypothetical protein
MSSSEETIFGDAFFEPIVKGVCGGVAAGGQGVDVVVETEDAYTVISVKSGPNWGNSSQMANHPKQHRLKYEAEWVKAVNRFTGEFINEFCAEDGAIDWEKLAAFNSGEKTGKTRNKE